MERFQQALPSQAVKAIDHRTIEGALCKMIGFQQKVIMNTGLVDKRRAAELVNGRALWRQDEIDDVRLTAVYEVACRLQAAIRYDLDYGDDQLDAMAALWRANSRHRVADVAVVARQIEIGSPGFSVDLRWIAWAVRTAR